MSLTALHRKGPRNALRLSSLAQERPWLVMLVAVLGMSPQQQGRPGFMAALYHCLHRQFMPASSRPWALLLQAR